MPFFQTALIHDENENIIHVASVRMRALGSGNLQSKLFTQDSIRSSVLANLALTATNNREPAVLANFSSQRVMIRCFTDQLDEWFNIDSVTFYIKPLWASKPL